MNRDAIEPTPWAEERRLARSELFKEIARLTRHDPKPGDLKEPTKGILERRRPEAGSSSAR